MKLNFKPLSHNTWIQNAIIPVNKHFQLSISYGDKLWYVGDINDYEVAIQRIHPNYPNIACLVTDKQSKTNTYGHCDERQIDTLIEKAKTYKPGKIIEIFDIFSNIEKAEDFNNEPSWGVRFLCAKGYDEKEKLKYAKSIWKPNQIRIKE